MARKIETIIDGAGLALLELEFNVVVGVEINVVE